MELFILRFLIGIPTDKTQNKPIIIDRGCLEIIFLKTYTQWTIYWTLHKLPFVNKVLHSAAFEKCDSLYNTWEKSSKISNFCFHTFHKKLKRFSIFLKRVTKGKCDVIDYKKLQTISNYKFYNFLWA